MSPIGMLRQWAEMIRAVRWRRVGLVCCRPMTDVMDTYGDDQKVVSATTSGLCRFLVHGLPLC